MIFRSALLSIFMLLSYRHSNAQNVNTGTWNGIFYTSYIRLGNPKLVVEIFDFKDSMFTGITHLYYRDGKYEHYRMAGKYFQKDSLFVMMEVSTIAVDLGMYGNCLGTYYLKNKYKAGYLLLDGIWKPNIPDCSENSIITLQKKLPEIKRNSSPVKQQTAKNKQQTNAPVVNKEQNKDLKPLKREKAVNITGAIEPVKKNDPVIKILPVMPAVISKRDTDIQSLLEIDIADKDSIRVDVYDNGDIDGDSVSVYENERQRIFKKEISAKPITFYVSLNKTTNPIMHLRLVAESLGSIPPCTALMIVTTRTKRYEVHLSSNFRKNATLELFLKN